MQFRIKDSKSEMSVWLLTVSTVVAVVCGFSLFLFFSKHENTVRVHSLSYVNKMVEASSGISNGSGRTNGEHLRYLLSGYFGRKILVTLSIDSHQPDRLMGHWQFSSNSETASTYLQLNSQPQATDLFVKVQWQSRFAASGDSVAWGITGCVPLLILLITWLITEILRRTTILPMATTIEELSQKMQDSRDMQMFAHDIRKPFSALRAMLELLHKKRASDEVREVATRLLPEMDALLLHVDGMIADVMKKESSSDKEPISVSMVLDHALKEVVRKHPHASQKIDWQLRNSLKISAEDKPLIRALANLICNAVEATTASDRLWISTRDHDLDGHLAVEITIGNSGLPIPAEILGNLFQPFFTSGKSGGTGLGLAYVKKTAETFGGSVTVRSDDNLGTEFSILLPAATVLDKIMTVLLPDLEAYGCTTQDFPLPGKVVQTSGTREKRVKSLPVQILVLEDESYYFDSLVASVHDDLKPITNFLHATSAKSAIDLLAKNKIDLVICDYDLGTGSENGLSVVRYLQRTNSTAKIYMHTNKTLTGDDARFVDQHTSGFLSKPANGNSLHRVISEAAHNAQQKPQSDERPRVAIIDDDCFIRELWSLQSTDIQACLYSSPEEFLNEIAKNPELLPSFDAIIIDYYFDENSNFTGDQLARKIRKQVEVPIIMSSDIGDLSGEQLAAFDVRIEKNCQSWPDISGIILKQTGSGF